MTERTGRGRSRADLLRFAAFIVGEALLVVAFIVLARTPGEHSFAYYAKLVAVEIACVVLALATEVR